MNEKMLASHHLEVGGSVPRIDAFYSKGCSLTVLKLKKKSKQSKITTADN